MTAIGTRDDAVRRHVRLTIDGMTCAACADRVRRAVEALDGTSATVDRLTGTADIDAPRRYRTADLCRVVEAAGYSAAPRGTVPDPVDAGHPASPYAAPLRRASAATAVLVAASLAQDTIVPAWWPWSLLAVAAACVVGTAHPIHRAAWRAARRGHATMDTLTSFGLLGTLAYAGAAAAGAVGAAQDSASGRYACVAAAVTAVALAGRHLERRAEQRAGRAIRDLTALVARNVTVRGIDGTETEAPIDALAEGQSFVVRPGEVVAADGLVVHGRSAMDVSALTGETAVVSVGAGSAVTAGTVAVDGPLVVEAAAVGEATRLARMLRSIDRAHTYRGDFQRLADRVAGRFVPGVFGLAALAVIGWLLLDGPPASAVRAGLAVVLAACPCALGLATPTALLVASGQAARLGIFFKGQRGLEQAAGGGVVVFDKTGTLTAGGPGVVAVHLGPGIERAQALRAAAAVEAVSRHPVAAAIIATARTDDLEVATANRVTEHPGRGVIGVVGHRRVAVGRPSFVRDHGFAVSPELRETLRAEEYLGRTAVLVAVGDRAVAVLAVAEQVHPSAASAVARLRALGLRSVLLTGDNPFAAQEVADRVGIEDVIASVMPEDKAEVVRALQDSGRHVTVVGDGVNDGPALAVADLGIALGAGTDVAMEAADLVISGRDLTRVPYAIGLAAATLATIRTNLRWALGYNLVVLPLAVVVLDPLGAAAAMALSSMFVVSNSLRLRRFTLPNLADGRDAHPGDDASVRVSPGIACEGGFPDDSSATIPVRLICRDRRESRVGGGRHSFTEMPSEGNPV
ncbi:cation-translocating P-type ATPase [Nocardia sp. NBC_01377]|uniref:heavy metal translocating P-type ATPase n=1 Tax=Nocardia sp. NBC_01377 TaxID=2903595 RepID=UPI003249340B